MNRFNHFLLVFDHESGKLTSTEQYSDSAEAVRAYFDCETNYRDNDSIEIVLIGADSLDTIRLTHANYFDGTAQVSRFLTAI